MPQPLSPGGRGQSRKLKGGRSSRSCIGQGVGVGFGGFVGLGGAVVGVTAAVGVMASVVGDGGGATVAEADGDGAGVGEDVGVETGVCVGVAVAVAPAMSDGRLKKTLRLVTAMAHTTTSRISKHPPATRAAVFLDID
jgi:hypothetical protein